MKYNIKDTFTTRNTLVVKVDQKGSKAMIRERGQDCAKLKQGYRVMVSDECIVLGSYDSTETSVLLEAVKRERYAHIAYKEAYYDLIQKFASIGFSQIETKDEDDRL